MTAGYLETSSSALTERRYSKKMGVFTKDGIAPTGIEPVFWP